MAWLADMTVNVTVTIGIILVLKALFGRRMSERGHVLIWGILFVRFFVPVLPKSRISVFNYIRMPESVHVLRSGFFGGWADAADTGMSAAAEHGAEAALVGASHAADMANIADAADGAGISPAGASSDAFMQKPFGSGTGGSSFLTDGTAGDGGFGGFHMSEIAFGDVLFLFWLAGMILLFGCFLITWISYSAKLKKAESCDDPEVLAILEECRRTVDVKRQVRIVRGGESPMLKGAARPVILLPQGYSKAEIRDIFLHELCHCKNGDILIIYAGVFTLCVNWFNLAAWYAFFVLRRDIEIYCDQRALQHVRSRKDYAALLLKTALGKNRFIPGTTSYQNGEKEVTRRIKHMARITKPKAIWAVFVIAAVVAAGGFCLTNGMGNSGETGNMVSGDENLASAVQLSQKEGDENSVTAVVLRDTALYADREKSQTAAELKKNDLVIMVRQEEDGMYGVQLPAMEVPTACGYVAAEDISFDRAEFSEARFGVIRDAVVYNTEDVSDIYSESESGVIEIDRYDGNFVYCDLPGGVSGKVVKKDAVSYDLTLPDELYAKTQLYLQDEMFRVFKPYYRITNLSISNWERNGNEATFGYTMTHEYYNRDPEKVGWLQEVKAHNPENYDLIVKDYFEPKDGNFNFKIVEENGELNLFSDVSVNGPAEWDPCRIDDYLLS